MLSVANLCIADGDDSLNSPFKALTQLSYSIGNRMKRYECIVCGWIYDEALGCPEEGIAPGTKWEDIPDDWTCPECGVGKLDFEMLEM